MKKTAKKSRKPEMLKEYDFSGGTRGEYAKRYAAGTNIVVLEPDIARAFRDSKSVNTALRGLLKSRTHRARRESA
jgi:hypothetical protein